MCMGFQVLAGVSTGTHSTASALETDRICQECNHETNAMQAYKSSAQCGCAVLANLPLDSPLWWWAAVCVMVVEVSA